MTIELERPTVPETLLRSESSLTGDPDGQLAAAIALHGELCAASAPQLHEEIRRLIDGGAMRLVLDLADLRLCTSQGLDVFDAAHRRLRSPGSVRLRNAGGVVDRVLSIVEDADPTFPPLR